MPESTDSNSKMLEIPDVNGTDPVFTMSRAVDAGSISFRAVMQKEGGYYCSLGKDAKTNYTHQINLGFENKYGVNSTGGINGPKFITLFNVPTRFTYKMEFTATEQLHYINDILVYTSTISIEPVDGSNHYPGLFNKTMYIDNVAILDEAGVTLLPGGVDVLDMEPYTIGESAKNTTLVTEYGLIGWNGDNTLIDFVNIVANPVKSTSELLTGNWNCTRLSVSSQAGVRESEVFSTEDVTPPGISADMFLNIAANNSGHMTRLYNTAILNETDTFDDDALFGSGTDRHPDDYTTILDGPTYRATPVSTNGSTEITLNGTTVNPAYLVYYAVSNNSINYGVPDESMNNRTYQIIELTDTTMTLSIGFETSTGVQNYWNATYNKDSTSYPLYLRILMFETYAELIADGVTSAEIRALGLSIQQLNDMGANFKELEYLDIQELLDFGVSVATLALYFTLVELKLVIDLAGLKKGFTLAELKAEFTLAELKLEFELSELKAEFTLAELMAEFELAELKAIVFSLTAEIDGGSDSNYTYMEASTDGTTFAVSNNEKQQVEVYHKVDSLWLLKGSPIAFTANTGYSVDLNSNGSVVSFGQINNLEGGVKVYRYNDASTEWELLGSPIVAPGIANTPGLGYRTKLNEAGTIVAASSPYQQDGANEIVIVSRYVDGEWSQLGNTIDNLDVTAGRKDNGYALDISANGLTLVVGARLEDSFSGIIRVFTYNDGSSLWEQKGDTITRAQLSDVDLSGSYVSMNSSGSMIAISDHDDASGAGATRIFEYDDASSSWLQIGEDIVGEADGDQSSFFGLKLSADGSTVAIGAPYNDGSGIDSGHIRVYQYVDGTWTQFGADINGTGPGNLFGWYMTMSSSADTIFADVGNNNTKINIYDKLSAFTLAELKLEFTLAELKLEFELAELKLEFELAELIEAGFTATELKLEFELAELKELFTLRELYDAGFTIADLLALRGDINFVQLGQDIDGEAEGDWSVAVSTSADGSIVAIGARYNDGNESNSGHVRVYQNVSGTWTQLGQDIDGEAAGDQSGYSVSLSADGSIVAIGASRNDGNGSSSGHVRVYKNESGTWTQIGQDIDGEAEYNYSGRSVSLSADGSIVAIGAANDDNGSVSGHVRVYKNESGTWTQIGQDIDGEAEFDSSGRSVSLSADGSIVAIGAIGNDDNGTTSGHVRVYQNVSGTWTQIGQDLDGEAAGDSSGISVSLSADGSIVAIGANGNDGNGYGSGHVRVYQNVSGTWTKIGQDIDGEAERDYSGYSVSLSADGSIVAIGAYNNNNGNGYYSGHVRVYQNESGTWTQIGQDIDGESAYDQSGRSVSLSADGSIVAIGATYNGGVNGSYSGHVRVYQKVVIGVTIDDLIAAGFTAAEFKAAGYTLVELITFGFTLVELKLEFEFVELIEAGFSIAELRAAGFTVAEFNVSPGWTQIGQYIDGEAAGDQSGSSGLSLSADGSIVAIGAPYNDGNGNDSGHVRVYKNESGNWTQIGQDIDGEAVTDRSGFSVSLSADGSIVAIGAIYNGGVNGSYSGHVRVYQNVSGTWTQIGQDIDGEAASDYSGYSVSLSNDGSIVAIGAYGNDDNGSTSGHVRVYQNVSGTWTKIGQDIDGEAERDQSGYSVSLSADGSIVAIGAPINDGNGTYSGHVRVYKNESGTWTQIGQDIDGEAIYDWSGHSVSLSADGSIVAIGAPYNDANGYSSGHVRVYQNVSGTWTQIGQDLDGEAIYDYSGFNSTVSLSADGSIVAIGARYNDGVNGPNTGHVRVYQNVSGTWTQLGQDLDGEALNAYAGYSVSLSNDGSIVAIGAPYNDSNGYASGHVRVMKYDSYSLTTPLAELVAVFTLAELKLEFELAELVAFFTLAELKDAGFPLRELFEGGFTLRELFEGGFTLRELLETIKEPITILGLDTYGDLWNGGKLDLEKSDNNWETFIDIPLNIDYNLWPSGRDIWNAHKVTVGLAGGNYRIKLNPIGTWSSEIKFAATTKQEIVDKYVNTGMTITETDILVPQTLVNEERYFVVLDNDDLLAELKEIFTLAELKLEFELAELIAAGFTLAELKLEFELAELKLEFELAELKLEFELAELVAGGFTLAELKLEFELAELMLLELFVLADFKAAGYTVAELKAGGFTIAELLAVGFTDLEIARGGFTATQMFEADINPLVFKNDVPTSEFRDFGYTCKIARLVYPIADVVSAYTSIELKNAGVNIETLVNYKKPLADIKTAYSDITTTYTPVQLKPIYTIREMSAIYSITELTDAFTLLQMNNEYSLPELLELGAYDFEQMDLDFTFPELRGKFTLRELNTVFSLVKLHTELSFKVLNGEFTLRELNKFFTLKELHTEFTLARINESFTLVEMNAEFTLKELREAFSYNQLRNEFTALELAEGNVYD